MNTTNTTTDCTYCGASAGAPCRTATGNRAARPHAARVQAAETVAETAEPNNAPHPAARRITATGTVANRRCGDGITRTVIELDTGDRIAFESGSATAENNGLRAGDRVTFTATVTRSKMDRYEIFDHYVIDFRPAGEDKTFTLDDVAIAAARRAGIPTRDALAAAEACIHRIGKHSGRIIDPDGITEDDADFLIGAIQFDHVTGDLVPA